MSILLHENDRASATIVTSPTGLKHGITLANSHTWCGRDADHWTEYMSGKLLYRLLKTFKGKSLTCRQCYAIWRRR